MSDVKNLRLAIGTPMHSDICTGTYKSALDALKRALWQDGKDVVDLHLGNESHIQRGRNTIAARFLETDCTHLLWWDGDIGVPTRHLAKMVVADKEIIGAPCPLKAINWARIVEAVKQGVPAEELHRHTGMFNVIRKDCDEVINLNEPFEVERIGTGLMLVKREAYERIIAHGEVKSHQVAGEFNPDLVVQSYKNSWAAVIAKGKRVYDFHHTFIQHDDLLSEDYGFCELAKAAGLKIWAAPWVRVVHVGAYPFGGCFADCLRTDAATHKLQMEKGDNDGGEPERAGETRAA